MKTEPTDSHPRNGLLTPNITFLRILCVAAILVATSLGWVVLGGALAQRSASRQGQLQGTVTGGWGPALAQSHPSASLASPAGGAVTVVQPETSNVRAKIDYGSKRKGLLWYRTYDVRFDAHYVFTNPNPVPQVIRVAFPLPAERASYHDILFQVGDDKPALQAPEENRLVGTATIPPLGSVAVTVGYRTRGLDRWSYLFPDPSRIRGFQLAMATNFHEIDFPAGSPTRRERNGQGWTLAWDYPDVISAQSIALEMPNVLNPGPVAMRICFFAPVSLLFYFSVLVILGIVQRQNLHPMHFFFLAAGCFAFQLLFAYLVDLLPLTLSFVIAAAVSLGLVGAYLHAVSGGALTRTGLIAQGAYMVLFSYSFFFDGLTGITLTVGAIATLAVLMISTARLDWATRFGKPRPSVPPPLPTASAGA